MKIDRNRHIRDILDSTAFERLALKTRKKLTLWKQQKGRCFYCDNRIDKLRNLTMDHLVPQSRGGKNGLWNLVACCVHCNQVYGDDSVKQKMIALKAINKRPVYDIYVEKTWWDILKEQFTEYYDSLGLKNDNPQPDRP